MTGKYKLTSDDAIYEVYVGKVKGKDQLMAQCVSSATKNGEGFPISKENLGMNIRRGLWVKIEE